MALSVVRISINLWHVHCINSIAVIALGISDKKAGWQFKQHVRNYWIANQFEYTFVYTDTKQQIVEMIL